MTLFISELDIERKKVITMGISNICVSFLCWVFSAIYIACGHGKTSGAMVCLLVPFFVSGMAILIVGLTRFYKIITLSIRCLLNLSMTSFTVGMALLGVFKIAGVPNSIFLVPIWIGGVITALFCVGFLIANIKKLSEEI